MPSTPEPITPSGKRFAFLASTTHYAGDAKKALEARYGRCEPDEADIIVALGGDGTMLEAIHGDSCGGKAIFGMNRGTVGFLMNQFEEDNLVGWGKSVSVGYESDEEREIWSYRYIDPNVFSSRWRLRLEHSTDRKGE